MINIDLEKYTTKHSPGYVIEVFNNGTHEEMVLGNSEVVPSIKKTTKDTLYDIASLTKVFTATLVYIAFEERRLDLYIPITSIEPKFTNLVDVRIIDLLSHNQNIWTDGYLGISKNKDDFYRILYTAYVKEKIPTYVDVHYMILGVILEKIYNKPYDELCREKIFKKVGMNNTTFNPCPKDAASCNYEHTENGTIDYITPGLIHDTKARVAKKFGINLGHASIFTTGLDLYKFLKTFLDCSLLKESTISLMLSHRCDNERNFEVLNELYHGDDINIMYRQLLKDEKELPILYTYNNMSTRYRNNIDELNDVPKSASDNSITFSGYTGPMFTIDFDKKIIIVIMCNVIHNSYLTRKERKQITTEIMNIIFDEITNT